MLMMARKPGHLLDFGRRHVAWKNPANTSTFAMDLEHNLDRLFTAEGEKLLQHYDYEIHGGVIII